MNNPAAHLKKRYAAERRFKAVGLLAVLFSGFVLAFLLINMTSNAIGGFKRWELRFPVDLTAGGLTVDPSQLQGADPMQALQGAGLADVVAFAATQSVGDQAAGEVLDGAWREVGEELIADPQRLQGKIDVSLPVSDDLAGAARGGGTPEMQALAQRLKAEGKLVNAVDWGFLSRADATGPQAVGIWGALKGSMLTMLVTLALAFPIGVLAAVYLEEYAPKNRWTEWIEV